MEKRLKKQKEIEQNSRLRIATNQLTNKRTNKATNKLNTNKQPTNRVPYDRVEPKYSLPNLRQQVLYPNFRPENAKSP